MRKILSICAAMLMICSTLISIGFIKEVKAIPDDPSINPNPLNMSYVWVKTGELANITYQYPTGYIPKGRAFGSWGGEQAAVILENLMSNLSLTTSREKIEAIDNIYYNRILNITDFQLQVYNTGTYPYPVYVPKKESFAFPAGHLLANDNFSFENVTVKEIDIKGKNLIDITEDLYDFEYTVFHSNCKINKDLTFAGEVVYLDDTASIPDPEDQCGIIYILNETADINSTLENLTSSKGCIIIDNASLGGSAINKTMLSIANVSYSTGPQLRDLLLSHNDSMGCIEDGVLTIMYNFTCKLLSDYAFIDQMPNYEGIREWLDEKYFKPESMWPQSRFNAYWKQIGFVVDFFSFFPHFCGLVLYESYDQHLMGDTGYVWKPLFFFPDRHPVLLTNRRPIFSVNKSVGESIVNDKLNTKLTAHVNRSVDDVTAYNVLGNLTIPRSPDDKIAVISNRYDGWWGQTPGDSGFGAGIVLGIARHLKELKDQYNILPKYNTTFLFTTGEEYGLRGAHHYSDVHKRTSVFDEGYNISFWLVLDQLAFNQSHVITEASITNSEDALKAMINDLNFEVRTGYPIESPSGSLAGTEQKVYADAFNSWFSPADIVCIADDKHYEWDFYHRTGQNYTKGDSMAALDRDKGNVTAELAWNITKYFLLNPNCWFDGSVSYSRVDTSNDGDANYDSINATFTVKTSLPSDKVRVRAMMKGTYNVTRFWKDFDFWATSQGTQKTITVTLPPTFLSEGDYHLYLQLFNSTGRIDLLASGSGICNDTDLQTGDYSLYPRGNTNANKPNDIQGPDTLKVFEPGTFNSSATDPNNDQLQYHWDWSIDTDRVGPYASGALCSINHTYLPPRGERTIKVKVREDYKGQLYDGGLSDLYRYGSWSQWSDPFTVDVDPLIDFDMACTAAALAKSATQSTVLSSIQETNSIYEGFAFGGIAPYTYTWYFEYHIGPPPCNQTVTYNYSQPGIKTVTLNVIDYDNNSDEITANITIVNLSASYNISLPSLYTLPGENITFNDTSAVISSRSIENWTWDFGDGTVCYERNPTHYYYYPGLYNCTLTVTDDERETKTYAKTIIINYDDTPPLVNSVFSSPSGIGYGINVSIMAVVTDDVSGVKTVHANITKPDNTTENLTMMHVVNDYYYCVFNDTTQPGTYNYNIWVVDQADNMDWIPDIGEFILDFDEPQITMTSTEPHTVGFGYNVTISANVTDSVSGIDTVCVNITSPSEMRGNYTMSYTSGDNYQYVFTDTWLTGQYNYTIWVTDNSNNINSSSGHHFHVSAQATMSIATLKDSYSGSQYINITDPPNPPQNLTLVDRGLTWNTYYNATTGQNILETYQGPVNYPEENGTWTPINNTLAPLGSNHPAYVYGYRNGNDHGLYGVYFKSNAQQEWPVAFTYNKSDDPTIHAVRSKLVGVGYVDPQSNWTYQYLQNVKSSQGQINDYSITFPGVFTGADVTWSYGNTGLKEEITLSNTTKTVLQNHPASQYGLNDASSYLVFITKLDYQNLNLYNGSGVLNGNVTISDAGVEFRNILGQFRCALPLGEAYEMNNESNREKLTYRIVHLNGNTYLLSGLKVSRLNAMTFPVVIDPTLTAYSTTNDGYIHKSSTTSYNTAWSASSGTVYSSADYLTIGQKKGTRDPPDYNVYRSFVFFNTSALPSNAYLDNATLSIYKRDDYSTTDFAITIQNGQPTYPHDPLQSGDYNKSCYSGNGGSLNTASLTSGYNAISLNNLAWINKTGITKLCLRSSRDISGTAPTGNEYVNVYSRDFIFSYPPKLVINYRNQSKIKNTGSTNIKGYLLIQVQFYETGKGIAPRWVVDNDTINETLPRTINTGNQLGLDTVFNGKIRASDLKHGAGTYRVYAAFRDPEGNILNTSDQTKLEAWWLFSKT